VKPDDWQSAEVDSLVKELHDTHAITRDEFERIGRERRLYLQQQAQQIGPMNALGSGGYVSGRAQIGDMLNVPLGAPIRVNYNPYATINPFRKG